MRPLTTDQFIEKAVALHGGRYDYSKVRYVNAKTPVEIICRKHGAFEQLPYNHLKGQGCTLCNKVEKRRMGIDEFLERARKVHGDTYDYSKAVYVNSKTPVCIGCPVHGDFMQKPEKHLAGQGCPKCAVNYKDTTESFIEKARLKHGDFYDYSKVQYVDEHTKVCIIDREYGEFWQQPNSHLSGRGNPLRRAEKTFMTKLQKGSLNSCETDVYKLLTERFGNDDVVQEYWSGVYPFPCDFYIRSLDLYIELNLYGTHCGHWFDASSEKDLAKLQRLLKKSETSSWSRNCIKVWTKSDVAKREVAVGNDLNYVVFWKNDLSDFLDWYHNFDPEHPVLKLY